MRLANAVTTGPVRTDWLTNFRRRQDSVTVPVKALPLRLLFVATSQGEGGIERHSVHLAASLAERGASVTYACTPAGMLDRLCRSRGVETAPLTVRNSGDLRSVVCLIRLILNRNITVVHVHSRRDFVGAVLAVSSVRLLRGRGPVLILHAHLLKKMGDPTGLSGRFFERGAHAVIAVSEATRTFLIATHRFNPAFVSLMHNGIDTRPFELPPQSRQAARKRKRRQWGVPDDALVIGMVGRLGAKGQTLLLAAAPLLLSRFPGVRFVFVGPEGEDGTLASLRQSADRAGVTPQVVFTGPSEEIPAMMAGMDILVHLPEEESFGLVLVEAMAAGLPVIATDVGGCREVIEDGVTGLLIQARDECGLVEALSLLLVPGAVVLRQRMGFAGRRRARRLFSLQQEAEGLEARYQDLLRISGRNGYNTSNNGNF